MPYEVFPPFEPYPWDHPYYNFSQFLKCGRSFVEHSPGRSFQYEFDAPTQLHTITFKMSYAPGLPVPVFGTGRMNALPPPQPFYYYNSSNGHNSFIPPPLSVLTSPFQSAVPRLANTSAAQTFGSLAAQPGGGRIPQRPPVQHYSMPLQNLSQYPQQYINPALVQPPPYNAIYGATQPLQYPVPQYGLANPPRGVQNMNMPDR